jgi:hypothetical protein
MQIEMQEGQRTPSHTTIALKVRYLAAGKPYVDPKAQQSETLTAIKPLVLDFFGLVEGAVDGGTKTYNFVLNDEVLTNLSATLVSLAEGKHELKLDLVERFEQG